MDADLCIKKQVVTIIALSKFTVEDEIRSGNLKVNCKEENQQKRT